MIIIIPPNYQKGFEGFIRECSLNGHHILSTSPQFEYVSFLPSFSWTIIFKKFDRAALWIPSLYHLLKTIKKTRESEVHLIGEPTYLANIIIYLALKISGHEPKWSCRIAQNMKFWMPFFFWLPIELFKKNNCLAFPVSKLSQNLAHIHYGITNTKILPNGFPSEFSSPIKTKSTLRHRITFIGNFLDRKGINDFLELSKSNNINLEFKFTAIGCSKEQISFYKKEFPKVEFQKKTERENLIKFLDETACLIVPSKTVIHNDLKGIQRFITVPWSEQFGRVIIEAYSRGANVIAYKSGAIPEYIYNKKYLVDENNLEDLKDLLSKFLTSKKHHQLEFTNMLIEYSKQFKWEAIYNKFLKLRSGS